MSDRERRGDTRPTATLFPGDLILEPAERVLVATRPLFLWELFVLLFVVLVIGAVFASGQGQNVLAGVLIIAALALLVWVLFKWIPWSRRWYVLTDRRVIARWGVFNRNQAALLLDRVQDASLARPFPLSLIRDYGVIHVESAGENSQDRISSGLQNLSMTNASTFYRALTDAQTPT